MANYAVRDNIVILLAVALKVVSFTLVIQNIFVHIIVSAVSLSSPPVPYELASLSVDFCASDVATLTVSTPWRTYMCVPHTLYGPDPTVGLGA